MKLYTNYNGKEGLGAIYQKIIETYCFCKYNNIKYVYRPPTDMEHNYDNEPTFIINIENVMNLKMNIDNDTENIAEVIDFGKHVQGWFDNNIDIICNGPHLSFIKKIFWENKDKCVFKNDKTNIALHVRRPNQHDNRIEGANTPDAYYLNIMDNIRTKYNNNNLLFHIYSQGDDSNFEIYKGSDVQLHLNEDICSTFIDLVGADILVTSASSLSYIAAIISDGEIYYKSFWHKPRKEWTVC